MAQDTAGAMSIHPPAPSPHSPPRPASPAMQDTVACGIGLREAFVAGTLSQEVQRSLLLMDELRKGLISDPLPPNVHLAIINNKYNPELKAILVTELQHAGVANPSGLLRDQQQPVVAGSPNSALYRSDSEGSSLEAGGPNMRAFFAVTHPDTTTVEQPAPKKVYTMKRSKASEQLSRRATVQGALATPLERTVSRDRSNAASALPLDSSHPAKIRGDSTPSTPWSAQGSGTARGPGSTNITPSGKQNGMAGPSQSELRAHSTSRLESGHLTDLGGAQSHQLKRKRNGDLLNQSQETHEHRSQPASIIGGFGQWQRDAGAPINSTPRYHELSPDLVHRAASSSASVPSLSGAESRAVIVPPIQATQQNFRGVESFESSGSSQSPELLAVEGADLSMDDTDIEATTDDESSIGEYQSADGGGDGMDGDPLSSVVQIPEVELTTDDGRPYNEWRLADGTKKITYGALLPTGYQTYKDPDLPWICPIRSCRVLFPTLNGLGSHFNMIHRTTLLNDNGDGTLSVLNFRIGAGRLPARVVTKNPLNPAEAPMPEPSLRGKPKRVEGNRATLRNATPNLPPTYSGSTSPAEVNQQPSSDEDAIPSKLDGVAESNWKRIVHPHLKNTSLSPIPQTGHVPQLLPLPQVRKLIFNPHFPSGYAESRIQDISALIIQITGEKASTPCTRCRKGKGPFSGCVVISPNAPLQSRCRITSCANCFYKGNQVRCGELTKWHREQYPELFVGPKPNLTPGQLNNYDPTPQARPGRNDTASRKPSSLAGDQSLRKSNRELRQPRSDKVQSPSSKAVPGGSHPAGLVPDGAPDMVMEDWEIAPGRFRKTPGEHIENIAFSGPYLRSNDEVVIDRDEGAHIISIHPGTKHRFQAIANRKRSCWIASGKVRVTGLGEDFDIGQDSMFRISPDTICTVENRWYADAKLFVSVHHGQI